jgi:hypothetical protein
MDVIGLQLLTYDYKSTSHHKFTVVMKIMQYSFIHNSYISWILCIVNTFDTKVYTSYFCYCFKASPFFARDLCNSFKTLNVKAHQP